LNCIIFEGVSGDTSPEYLVLSKRFIIINKIFNLGEDFGRVFFIFEKTPKGQDGKSSKLSGKWTEIGQNSGKIFISPKGQFSKLLRTSEILPNDLCRRFFREKSLRSKDRVLYKI